MRERSKAPLVLMEQVIMILVFAFAAALCVKAFVTTQNLSKEMMETDWACRQVQSAAEVFKACDAQPEKIAKILKANREDDGIVLYYDAAFAACKKEEAVYALTLMISEKEKYLLQGEIGMCRLPEGETIFSLLVFTQEVAP